MITLPVPSSSALTMRSDNREGNIKSSFLDLLSLNEEKETLNTVIFLFSSYERKKESISSTEETRISKADLLKDAEEELENYQKIANNSGNDLTPIHKKIFISSILFLEILLKDNSATPQFAPQPNGGIDIQWWVGTDYLIITLDPEYIAFNAWKDDYEDLFPPIEIRGIEKDIEFERKLVNGLLSSDALLQKMSANVVKRRPERA